MIKPLIYLKIKRNGVMMKYFVLMASFIISMATASATNVDQFVGKFELVSGNCPNQIEITKYSGSNIVVVDLAAADYERPYLWFEDVNKGVKSWVSGVYKEKSCYKTTQRRNVIELHEKNFLGVYAICSFAKLELGRRLQIDGKKLKLYSYGSNCQFNRVNN